MYRVNCQGFKGATRNPEDQKEIIYVTVNPHPFLSEEDIIEGSHGLCPYCSALYQSNSAPVVNRYAETHELRKVTLNPES